MDCLLMAFTNIFVMVDGSNQTTIANADACEEVVRRDFWLQRSLSCSA
jgi:hypothetical protein